MPGMIIDSHHHLWDLRLRKYSWMSAEVKPLHRNFLVDDLIQTIQPFPVSGTVVVQAHQSLEETKWLLQLATASNLILGVVGWVDLMDIHLAATLRELGKNPKFKGVRHLIQDEPDAHWVLQPKVIRGLKLIHEAGLVYDLLVKPHQLDSVLKLLGKIPSMPMIIDHIAKPSIRSGSQEPWASQMRELAQFPNLFCKISGLITEADHEGWQVNDFAFYLEHILAIFGWDRICWGSDWPVCLLAGDYGQVLDLPRQILRSDGNDMEWDAFMAGNASRFYGLTLPEGDLPPPIA
ncbi:MAG: amidohydrolase family protein [Terriglobia bacterium]